MKQLFLLTAILIFNILPQRCQAQNRFRRQSLKDVSAARHLAMNNTIIPLITGLGAAALFESPTLKTIGSSLAIYGLVVGPSTGNFYAQDYLRGSLGVLARLGSGYLLVDATRELMGKKVSESMGWDHESVSLSDTKVLVGAGLFLGSMVYNIISAKASVEEHNRSLGYGYGMKIGTDPLGRPEPMVTAYLRF